MPALQVRHMPEDLYEEIKLIAKNNRRSISQQTIELLSLAVDMLGKASVPEAGCELSRMRAEGVFPANAASALAKQESGDRAFGKQLSSFVPTAEDAQKRASKRKAFFDWVDANPISGFAEGFDSAAIVRECREERERELNARLGL